MASLVLTLSISFHPSDRNKMSSFTQNIWCAVNCKFNSTSCFIFQLHSLVSNTHTYLKAGPKTSMTQSACTHSHWRVKEFSQLVPSFSPYRKPYSYECNNFVMIVSGLTVSFSFRYSSSSSVLLCEREIKFRSKKKIEFYSP